MKHVKFAETIAQSLGSSKATNIADDSGIKPDETEDLYAEDTKSNGEKIIESEKRAVIRRKKELKKYEEEVVREHASNVKTEL